VAIQCLAGSGGHHIIQEIVKASIQYHVYRIPAMRHNIGTSPSLNLSDTTGVWIDRGHSWTIDSTSSSVSSVQTSFSNMVVWHNFSCRGQRLSTSFHAQNCALVGGRRCCFERCRLQGVKQETVSERRHTPYLGVGTKKDPKPSLAFPLPQRIDPSQVYQAINRGCWNRV
jgi:hypothetical protein